MIRLLQRNLSVALFLLIIEAPSTKAQQILDIRTIPLVAMTHKWQTVNHLTVSNLHLTQVKGAILSVLSDAHPKKIVFLLDISGSMGDTNYSPIPWTNARRFARDLLDRLPAADWVALDVFSEKAEEKLPFTHDFSSVQEFLDTLPAPDSKKAKKEYGNDTYFGDALAAILKNTADQLQLGDLIVVFSDGAFSEQGKIHLKAEKLVLQRTGIRVLWIVSSIQLSMALPQTLAPPSDSYADRVGLPDIEDVYMAGGGLMGRDTAEFMYETGGMAFQPSAVIHRDPDPALGFSDAFAHSILDGAAEFIRSAYFVKIQLDEPLTKPHRFRLQYISSDRKTASDMILYYPHSLQP